MDNRIRTDLGAMLSVRNLNNSFERLMKSMERLSGGRRLNRASDGPAQLVISEQLKSRIASLDREVENMSGQIHKYRTALASVGSLRDQLRELRSLAVGAANAGFNTDEAQAEFDRAASDLVSTYNETITDSRFNGMTLLDGSEGSLAAVASLSGIDLSDPSAAAESLEIVDAASRELDRVQSDLASTQKYELEWGRQSLLITRENLIAAESNLGDTDYAAEISTFTAELIRTRAATRLLLNGSLAGRDVLSLLGD